jgi:hypothetical protein
VPRRPAGLVYAENDRPPLPVLAALGVQHIFLMSSTLVLPVVLMSEIGSPFSQVRGVVALTMIACGIGTILQALRLPGFGSGFLCPNLCGPNFFAVSMSAAWLGGLPLMRGMTIAAGVVEAVFARVIRRLGFLFPPVGLNLFLSSSRFGKPMTSLYRIALPFLGIMFAGIFTMTVFFLFLPRKSPPPRHDWIFALVKKYVRWVVRNPAPMLWMATPLLLALTAIALLPRPQLVFDFSTHLTRRRFAGTAHIRFFCKDKTRFVRHIGKVCPDFADGGQH